MAAGRSVLPTVRKELRSVGHCTATHILDGLFRNADILELTSNERSEVAAGFGAFASDDLPTLRGFLHLARDVLVDFKGSDPNVGADGYDELGGVVRKGVDGARHDSSHCTTPPSVRRANVPARWMRDQHRHAIAGARGDPDAVDPRDQRITFFIGYRLRELGNIACPSPVDLALLVEEFDIEPEAPGKAGPVLPDRRVVVAETQAEVEAVVRWGTDAAQACRERMAKAVPFQKAGMQGGHRRICSTEGGGLGMKGPHAGVASGCFAALTDGPT